MAGPHYTHEYVSNHQLVGYDEARARGDIRYVNDKPCRRGHAPIRYVKNRMCCECVNMHNSSKSDEKKKQYSEAKKERYHAEPEKFRARSRKSYKRNAERAKRKRREYVKENYEEVREKKRQHRQDNIEQYRKKDKEYYRKNRERMREAAREYLRRTGYAKEYHRRNREKRNAYSREYGRKNPEIYRAKNARRRSAQREGVSGPSMKEWMNKQEKVCYWCGESCPRDFQVDHHFPLSRGGRHELDNLVIACPECNRIKHAKDPYEFANQRGRLF